MLKGLFAVLIIAGTSIAYADEPVPNGICENSDPAIGNSCFAYMGKDTANPKYLHRVSAACTHSKSKWTPNASCPTMNRMGICKMGEGTPHETWKVYYNGKTSANGTQNACVKFLKGNWYPQ